MNDASIVLAILTDVAINARFHRSKVVKNYQLFCCDIVQVLSRQSTHEMINEEFRQEDYEALKAVHTFEQPFEIMSSFVVFSH